MIRKLIALVVAAAVIVPSAASAKMFGLLNEAEVKDVVKAYLLENPEVVKEAMDNYAKREEEIKQKARLVTVESNRYALEHDANTPVIGNPNGDVTIVEFFDYNCGFCKMMFPKVYEFVKKDGNIRWVLKDMPVLSATSSAAAKAGLAANKQGKYFEMHQAMITHKGSLAEEDIVAMAKQIGLDMKKFEADRKDPAFDEIISANHDLANKLEFRGIPDFIIGNYISNGAMMGDELDVNVKKAREAK